MNKQLEKQVNDLLLWNDASARQLMEDIALEHHVSIDALAELVIWEREQQTS